MAHILLDSLFSVCGKQNIRHRVVGGQSVEVNEYPWMVGLKENGSDSPSCGAALLNSQWLVTVTVHKFTA